MPPPTPTSSTQSPPQAPPLALALPDELVEAIAARAATLVLEQLAAKQEQSPYLSVPEAAAYLRCKRQRIDDLLSARTLTRIKDGRRTLLLRTEIEALPGPTTGPGSGSRPTG